MEGLIMTGQLILGLSILVALHEFGHFITAKWFKMRVEKFYLFFDFLFPIPSLLNFALFKKKIGDTEYGLGWFPLGGYVSITGMVDETQDADALSKDPEPWEFRAKPAWQRLIVMLGGIIVNILLGIAIFVSLTYVNGDYFISKKELNKHGIVALELGQEIGLKTGDKILDVNGNPNFTFKDLRGPEVLMGDQAYYTIWREGKTLRVYIPKDFLNKLSDKRTEFIEPVATFSILEVSAPSAEGSGWFGSSKKEPLMPAYAAGLKKGDRILAINQDSIRFYHEFREKLLANAGKPVSLLIQRAGRLDSLKLTVTEAGKIGIFPNLEVKFDHQSYDLAQALPIGTSRAFGVIWENIRGFKKIFAGEVDASKALSGPIGIAQMFGGYWDWTRFWTLTGLLSMALAFMNALPIPALDGGHAVFLIYEMITGKPASLKVMERAQQIGMMILLALMAFTFGNDILKAFF